MFPTVPTSIPGSSTYSFPSIPTSIPGSHTYSSKIPVVTDEQLFEIFEDEMPQPSQSTVPTTPIPGTYPHTTSFRASSVSTATSSTSGVYPYPSLFSSHASTSTHLPSSSPAPTLQPSRVTISTQPATTSSPEVFIPKIIPQSSLERFKVMTVMENQGMFLKPQSLLANLIKGDITYKFDAKYGKISSSFTIPHPLHEAIKTILDRYLPNPSPDAFNRELINEIVSFTTPALQEDIRIAVIRHIESRKS